jgi:hypothetical protein
MIPWKSCCVRQMTEANCAAHTPTGNPGQKGKAHIVTTRLLCIAAVLVGIVGGTALAQSSDPLIGNWKLNVAKSKGAKSGSTTIEAAGQGVKFTVDLVGTDGTASHWSFTGNYDGKDNPVTGNSPWGNSAALTRVDARTIRITSKQAGKVMTTSTIVVSADGKTRTTTTKGTDLKGQPVDVVSLYEKQ